MKEGALAGLIDIDQFIYHLVVGFVFDAEAVKALYGFLIDANLGHYECIYTRHSLNCTDRVACAVLLEHQHRVV